MKKGIIKICKGLLVFVVVICVIAICVILFWKPFGKAPNKKLKEEYAKKSEYFYDGTFHPIESFELLTQYEGERSQPAFDKLPTDEIPVQTITSFPTVSKNEWNVTWFGHSSVMLQMENKNILIDPVFSDYASPMQAFFVKRFSKLPIEIEDLPDIDVVLISHDHYDHLDYHTIRNIDAKVKEYVVPLGVEQHLIRWGVNEKKIHTLTWWQEEKVRDISFTATPAKHYTGRLPWNNNTSLFAGYVLKLNQQQIYYTGDTGYGDFFEDIHSRFGKMDLMIVENGQYDKMWANTHMFPEQSVQASKTMETDVVLPVHWGAFSICNHGWKDSIERFTKAAKEENLNVITPMIGQSVGKNDTQNYQEAWWENIQ